MFRLEGTQQPNTSRGNDLTLKQPDTLSEYQSSGALSASSTISNVFSRLPRELRNRIYTFCVQGIYDDEVIVRRSAPGRTHHFVYLTREPCGQYSYQWVEDPVSLCLSAEGLGYGIAREMLECYYWTHTFKFAHHELCLLGPFLQADGFGFGMTPAYYARNLQIQIRPLDFAFLLPEKRAFEEQQCCRAIEALYAIQTTRTEIAIEVDTTQGSLSDADYERFTHEAAEFTTRIKSMVEHLREKGLRVTLGLGAS